MQAHIVSPKGVTAEALGQWHYSWVFVGSQPGDVTFKVTGFNFSTSVPSVVVCQARQSVNLDNGWSDQFAIQVIETGQDFVRIRVHRLDIPGGWGQNLRVDMIIVE